MDEETKAYIASLVGALQVGSTDQWEVSEPICVGGPNGLYTCQAPFLGDCEWSLDSASCGTSTSEVTISSSFKRSGPDFTGASGGFSGLSGFDGYVMQLMPNNTTPGSDHWYPVRDSNNTLYITISNASNAAFVNIQFRQKRNNNGANNSVSRR